MSDLIRSYNRRFCIEPGHDTPLVRPCDMENEFDGWRKRAIQYVAINEELRELCKQTVISTKDSAYWFRDGRLHRCGDQPAILTPDYTIYCKFGDIHRTDGPAIYGPFDLVEWYVNGYLHRDIGPAIEVYPDIKCWANNGKIHLIHNISDSNLCNKYYNTTFTTESWEVVDEALQTYGSRLNLLGRLLA